MRRRTHRAPRVTAPPPTPPRTSPGLRSRIAGAALALAAAVGIAHGSHVPLTLEDGTGAVLRVAFAARPERIEVCRTLTPAELEALPAHMRQPVSCEGTTAQYELEVRRDGEVLSRERLRGGGMRSDRQLYVFHETAIPAGRSTIEVRLARLDTAATDVAAVTAEQPPADSARTRRHDGEVPPLLELRESVTLGAREVVLVTYDGATRTLRAVRPTP